MYENLIEKAINRGTERVNKDLTTLTDPGQFNEMASVD